MKNFLFAGLVFAFLSLPAFAASFPDVPEDHVNFDAIEYLDNNDVLNGYEDGTFGPNNLVNRAEAAKIIVNAFGVSYDQAYEVIFPDVRTNQWFFKFVMGGREAGILNGYDDGMFRPGDTVNLAETLKMVVLATDISLPTEINEDVFLDVSKDVWYAPHALFARNRNVVFSDNQGNLNAGQPMTRAAFAEVIYRMMIVVENDGDAFPLHLNWSTYTGENIPFRMRYDDSEWQVIKNPNEVIFFNSDKGSLQFSPLRMYANSAVVSVSLDKNEEGLSKYEYFQNLGMAFPGAAYTEFDFRGFHALELLVPGERMVDWYIYLDNGDVLAVYTQFGNGVLGYKHQQVIKSMLSTFEYYEGGMGGNNYDSLLSEIFKSVLIEGTGMENLNKLPEKVIIETDTIGVGTGPVDYYYSETVNYTFKYERTLDLILDTRKGRTASF